MDKISYILSYCPYQKQFHFEEEGEFWGRSFDVFKRTKFKGGAYVPIKRFTSEDDYSKWFVDHITVNGDWKK